jgi:hypothetical protein
VPLDPERHNTALLAIRQLDTLVARGADVRLALNAPAELRKVAPATLESGPVASLALPASSGDDGGKK